MRFLVAMLILVASSALAQSVIRFALLPSDVQTAVVGFDALGMPNVRVQLTADASKRLERLTCANIGKQLELVIGDRVVVKARISQCIPDGAVQITGNYTLEEAQAIARNLEPNQTAPAQNRLEPLLNWFSELLKMLFRR